MNSFRAENLGKSYAGKMLMRNIRLGFGKGIILPPGQAPQSSSPVRTGLAIPCCGAYL